MGKIPPLGEDLMLTALSLEDISAETAWYDEVTGSVPGMGMLRARPSGVEEALLSGFGFTATDRAVAENLLEAESAWGWWTAAHRRFQHAALDHFVGLGHTQILDLGCGHPSGIGSSYQWITDYENASGRQLTYVGIDADPIVTSIMAERHDGRPHHLVRQGDLAHIGDLLEEPDIFSRLDPGRPVAVLAAGVLQHLHDPQAVLTALRRRLCAGSAVAVSHPDLPASPGGPLRETLAGYRLAVAPWYPRPALAAASILTGWHYVPDNLTSVGSWRPPGTSPRSELDRPTIYAPGWAVVATAAATR